MSGLAMICWPVPNCRRPPRLLEGPIQNPHRPSGQQIQLRARSTQDVLEQKAIRHDFFAAFHDAQARKRSTPINKRIK
jgi:hypothetical protein